MLVLCGRIAYSGIERNDFVDLKELSTKSFIKQLKNRVVGNNELLEKLCKLFSINRNILFCTMPISDIGNYGYGDNQYGFDIDKLINIHELSFETLLLKLKQYRKDTYIALYSHIKYDRLKGYTFSILPISAVTMPQYVTAQLRNTIIDNILKDIC